MSLLYSMSIVIVSLLLISYVGGTPKVYIGGGDNPTGAFDGYIKDPGGWPYVRANANGYYVNNFVLSPNETDQNQANILKTISGLFTRKSVFYETDTIHTTDDDDKAKIDILRQFFSVDLATLNYGYTASRIQALQWRAWRPVLAMGGPWTIDGDINSAAGEKLRDSIDHMSGSATDGPSGMWYNNSGNMQSGSYSMVKYSHGHQKMAMVMMATYTSGTGANLLRDGQDCVTRHENNGATPDIWVVSYYAAQLQQYPVTPEQVNGQPAGTVTGLAYWILRHIQGKSTLGVFEGEENDHGVILMSDSESTTLSISHMDDEWLDITPMIKVKVVDKGENWHFTVLLDGVPVDNYTNIPMIGKLRMYGGSKHYLTIIARSTNNGRKITGSKSIPASVVVELHPYLTESSDLAQVQTKNILVQ